VPASAPAYARLTEQLTTLPYPTHRIGYLAPVAVTDVVPYVFYRAFPDGPVLVQQDLGLRGYDSPAVWAAFERMQDVLDTFAAKDLDLLVLGGSVLSFAFERAQLLTRLAAIADHVHAPATTDVEATVAAMQEEGVTRVVVAHRLSGLADASVERYLGDAGLEVLGVVADPAPPEQNVRSDYGTAAARAEALAARTIERHPGAEGLFLLGGSWIVQPVAARLEAATGVRVFNNVTGFVWAAARAIDEKGRA
jgi:hypothetical protein